MSQKTRPPAVVSARRNISMPAPWWAAFEVQAAAEGLSLSAWLGECALANLPKAAAADLGARPSRGRRWPEAEAEPVKATRATR